MYIYIYFKFLALSTNLCNSKENEFYCGLKPIQTKLPFAFNHPTINSIQPFDYGYCIDQELQCDSIVHCHNGKDELPNSEMDLTKLPGYLIRSLVASNLSPTDLDKYGLGCANYKFNQFIVENQQNQTIKLNKLKTVRKYLTDLNLGKI